MSEDLNLKHQTERRRLTTIVAVDVCDYSKMSEMDELSAIKLMDDIFVISQKLVNRFRGRIFKTIADATLIEFPSAKDAIFFAVTLREDVTKQTQWRGQQNSVETRIGIHVGDIVDRLDGDILGHGVNVAVRLQEKAPRNGIMASSNVVNLISGDTGLNLKSVGKVSLKNIESPIGSYLVQQSNWWQHFNQRNKRVAMKIVTGLVLIGFLAFSYIQYQSGAVERVLVANNLIPAQLNDRGASARISKDALSTAYIRSVLENLRNSDQSSSKVVFALLEEGNIEQALKSLEEQTQTFRGDAKNVKHLELLHQIAALSYQSNPQRALAYYESILKIDPSDKTALIWKFRVENLLGYPEKAQSTYEEILLREDLSSYDRLLFTMDYAFSFTSLHEFEKAINILQGIEAEVIATGNRRLFAHWQTEIALPSIHLGRLEEADDLSISVIEILNEIGADTNLSRTHNFRGMIAERRASQNPGEAEVFLSSAFKHYEKEYIVASRINKVTDKVEGLYSMAGIELKRGNADLAQSHFLESLRLSRQSKHFLLEIYSLLGLAESSKAKKENDLACEYVSEIHTLFAIGRVTGATMKPALAKRVNAIECI